MRDKIRSLIKVLRKPLDKAEFITLSIIVGINLMLIDFGNLVCIYTWSWQSASVWLTLVMVFMISIIVSLLLWSPRIVAINSILLGLTLIIVLFNVTDSSRAFHGREYAKVVEVTSAEIANYPVRIEDVPILDESSANKVIKTKIGNLGDKVSQFTPSETTQICYKGKAIRVSSLDYVGLRAYWKQKNAGSPGNVLIDMQTGAGEFQEIKGGVKYSPSAYFSYDLTRHFKSKYPHDIISTYSFELDENGTPYWTIPIQKNKVGLFGAPDVVSLVTMNATTGEMKKYTMDKIPSWVDRVYSVELIHKQFNWKSLKDGYKKYWNGEGVYVASEEYNYIVHDNKLYVYSGITTKTDAMSNVGFLFTDQSTGKSLRYSCAVTDESVARKSAKGLMNKEYKTTFPCLILVEGVPTYELSLKDSAGLVKFYAMCKADSCQQIVSATTLEECYTKYVNMLNGISDDTDVSDASKYVDKTGIVDSISSAVIDGNSVYYLELDGVHYRLGLSNELIAILETGDKVTLKVSKNTQPEMINPAKLLKINY